MFAEGNMDVDSCHRLRVKVNRKWLMVNGNGWGNWFLQLKVYKSGKMKFSINHLTICYFA